MRGRIDRAQPGAELGREPAPPIDCSGTFSFQFTQAYMASRGLVPGTTVYCQWHSRDCGFAPPNNIGLTDAVMFTVCP